MMLKRNMARSAALALVTALILNLSVSSRAHAQAVPAGPDWTPGLLATTLFFLIPGLLGAGIARAIGAADETERLKEGMAADDRILGEIRAQSTQNNIVLDKIADNNAKLGRFVEQLNAARAGTPASTLPAR